MVRSSRWKSSPDTAFLVAGDAVRLFCRTSDGYGAAQPRPARRGNRIDAGAHGGRALAAGYRPARCIKAPGRRSVGD